ncbi:MAG: ion transporter [Bacteroidales bacterium]
MKKLFLNDRFILWMILLNAITIFMQGFEMESRYLNLARVADNFFTMIFLAEMIFKIREFSFSGYWAKNWNKFDALLIILATPSLVLWIFNLNDIGLQFLLVFRIARVFKFFRFIQFIPNVDKLIKGINQALKASVIVIIGFFIYNFVVSIVTCFLYQHIAPDYFGDPVQSFYTIFKIFTVEGWYEIPDLIAEQTNAVIAFFSKLYFILILLTGGIFGLSLVNSIFVDAMVSDNNEDLEKKVDELSKEISRLRQNLE